MPLASCFGQLDAVNGRLHGASQLVGGVASKGVREQAKWEEGETVDDWSEVVSPSSSSIEPLFGLIARLDAEKRETKTRERRS